MTETGTVYALTDPRDGSVRYIGQTTKTLAERLRSGYAPRVRSWIEELRTDGLAPQIAAVREGVPADDLLAAEAEEITRIIAAGGTLLNEQVTALGRKLLSERRQAERKAADRAAWAEVAIAALAILDGPLPPGDLPLIQIPDAPWRFMSTDGPARVKRANSALWPISLQEESGERFAVWQALDREQDVAEEQLWQCTGNAWGKIRNLGGDSFGDCIERNFRRALEARCTSPEDVSRFLALTIWYMAAVHPWRHLAELGGLATDDASFIAWVGRDAEVREALTFLAACGDEMMTQLSAERNYPQREKEPGRLLGAVAAAYSGIEPLGAIRSDLAATLGGMASDHMLTRPMADLLIHLDPGVLDVVFGKDITAEMDRELNLADGTSGRVLRALVDRIGHVYDGQVRRAADRSAQALPVTALPDYKGWSGPGIPVMMSVSGCLVRAGLAEPANMTTGEYLSYIRALWTPDLERLERLAA